MRLLQCGPATAALLLQEEAFPAAPRQPGLTRRESEVLHWIGESKRNQEIAEILGMSRRTVDKHIEHIFDKLGVETRTAAARYELERRRSAGG